MGKEGKGPVGEGITRRLAAPARPTGRRGEGSPPSPLTPDHKGAEQSWGRAEI